MKILKKKDNSLSAKIEFVSPTNPTKYDSQKKKKKKNRKSRAGVCVY